MNFSKMALLLTMVFCMFSCGDDAGECVEADWVGTYSGTIDCDGETEPVTVTVAASADNDTEILFSYVQDSGLETDLEAVTIDECEFAVDNTTTQGNGISATATLEGTTMTYNEDFTFNGVTSNCKFTATKN